MENLKPCPFCGDEGGLAVIESLTDEFSKSFFCYCSSGCLELHREETQEEAIKAWNLRKSEQEKNNGK